MKKCEEVLGASRCSLILFSLACVAVVVAVGGLAVMFHSQAPVEFSPEASVDLLLHEAVHATAPRIEDGSDSFFRVAIAPVISPEASAGLYRGLISYIAERMDLQPSMLRGKNYSAVNDLIRMRQCDMALVCTYSYVLAEAEFGARLLVAPEIDGKRDYHSLIIVPASSTITELSELQGKRFASCDVMSTSGWLYPMTLLKKQGFDAARFFGKHIISGSHDQSLFAVKSGVVDGTAVYSLGYENMIAADPTLQDELKVIHRSPPFGMPPLVVPAELPKDQFIKLQKVLLNMHTNAEGIRILNVLGFDRFFVPDNEAYDSVRDLHALWRSAP
jgi:phosphonate transport system substrate-binding protein